jgi:SAM-dependent methyltransferase
MIEAIRKFQRKDVELMERFSSTPFGAGFWCRQRLDKAIKAAAAEAHGTLLDIGCGMKPYRAALAPFVERHIGLEYSPETGYRGNLADFCGDAMNLPLGDETVDTILCTEVLEHIPDPEKAIAEFSRVLRPNGTIITTAPFFFPVHDDWDFFRYSPKGLAEIMERHGISVERIESLSGGGITLAMLFNLYLFDLGFMWTKWLYPIGVLLRPLLWLLIFLVNISGWVLDKIIPAPQMSFNHLTIGRKK